MARKKEFFEEILDHVEITEGLALSGEAYEKYDFDRIAGEDKHGLDDLFDTNFLDALAVAKQIRGDLQPILDAIDDYTDEHDERITESEFDYNVQTIIFSPELNLGVWKSVLNPEVVRFGAHSTILQTLGGLVKLVTENRLSHEQQSRLVELLKQEIDKLGDNIGSADFLKLVRKLAPQVKV